MDYETFKTELLEVLQRAAGEKKEVSLHQIEKITAFYWMALLSVRKGKKHSPHPLSGRTV